MKKLFKYVLVLGILFSITLTIYMKYGDSKVTRKIETTAAQVLGFIKNTPFTIKETIDYTVIEGIWYPTTTKIDYLVDTTFMKLIQVIDHQSYFMIKNYGNDLEIAVYDPVNNDIIHTVGKQIEYVYGVDKQKIYIYNTAIVYDSEYTWNMYIDFAKDGKTATAKIYTSYDKADYNIIMNLTRNPHDYVFSKKEDTKIIADIKKYIDDEEKQKKIIKQYHNKYCEIFGEEPVEIEKTFLQKTSDSIGNFFHVVSEKSKGAYNSVFGNDKKEVTNQSQST